MIKTLFGSACLKCVKRETSELARKFISMETKRINPYLAMITDPLLTLLQRRQKILDLMETGNIQPIWVFSGPGYDFSIPQQIYFVYNGNKRTVISREISTNVLANIIETDDDLYLAQEKEPRSLPKDVRFNYSSIKDYMIKRASQFASLNYQHSPLTLNIALSRRI